MRIKYDYYRKYIFLHVSTDHDEKSEFLTIHIILLFFFIQIKLNSWRSSVSDICGLQTACRLQTGYSGPRTVDCMKETLTEDCWPQIFKTAELNLTQIFVVLKRPFFLPLNSNAFSNWAKTCHVPWIKTHWVPGVSKTNSLGKLQHELSIRMWSGHAP